MKRAFTLLELLIVIAVLVILMGLVFKLSSVGGDSSRKSTTIIRLQRLENCLSGYYAAFGNYPPVKLHGSRDIYQRVGGHGIQTGQINKGIWNDEDIAWEQVKAACLSQPVACRYPYPEGLSEKVDIVSEEIKRRAESGDEEYAAYQTSSVLARLSAGFDDGVTRNVGRHAAGKNKTDWRNIQLFKFGLMSFLLPRYMVMMNGDEVFFRDYAQWNGNNEMPSNPMTGQSFSLNGGWAKVRDLATSANQSDLAKVANIPSQAVCARWMPNLQEICAANHDYTLFGIKINDPYSYGDLDPDNINIEIFSPGDANSGSTANQYVLDGITVRDGWSNEFYYYSPAPYQRYTLWSAGPNGRTFPPWINRDSKDLNSKANECIGKWIEDDIIRLSN